MKRVLELLSAVIPLFERYPAWVSMLAALWILATAALVITLLLVPRRPPAAQAAAGQSLSLEATSSNVNVYQAGRDVIVQPSAVPGAKSSDPLLPSPPDFDEWAREFKVARNPTGRLRTTEIASEESFEHAARLSSPAYRDLVSNLRNAIVAYRTEHKREVYVDLADIPLNVFSNAAASYRGQVIFSRDAAWSVWFTEARESERSGPVLELHLMDGDGTTKSGSGVGLIQLWYDFDASTIHLRASGTARGLLTEVPREIAVGEFSNYSPLIARRLVEAEFRGLR